MKSNTKHVSPEFPSDELLIFIGHSDDAAAEALAIVELQSEIEKYFRLLLKSNGGRSPFKRIRFCEDAPAMFGSQEVVENSALDHAQIAIFVFKDRVGKETWQELEKVRTRSREQPVQVLTFFSDAPSDSIKFHDLQAVQDWVTLLERRKSLTVDWTNPDVGLSVTPCPTYQSIEELKHIVSVKVRVAMADILAVESSILRPTLSQQVNTASDLLRSYQATLKQQLGIITLIGSPVLESFAVKLSETFVSLSLSATSLCEVRSSADVEPWYEAEYQRSSTPEKVMSFVFQHHPLLLVIGDPGSGKTTLLKYYALSCLDNERQQEFGFSEPVTVFFLPLRELKKDEHGAYSSLPAKLAAWSEKQFLKIEESCFSGWLDQPSTLILLDGLDEISDVHDRIAVCQWIDRTVGRFTNAKFVVTSRSTGYRKGDGIEIESSHLRADIMDFSKEQQSDFLHRWFRAAFLGELPPVSIDQSEWRSWQEQKATRKADAILAFLGQEKNRSLRSLAGVPLLLQIMAMLWKEREYMPASRLELYDAALNYMLDYRDRRRGIQPLFAAQDARRVLSPVCLWMQEELRTDEAVRSELQQQMQVQLDTLYNSLPALEFCRNLVDRAGLLVEYGDMEYIFRHKSFREYLAGVQLVKNMHRPDALKNLVSHFGDDWWSEVFRFFIAHVDDAELFDSFMEKLFDSPVTEELTQKQQDLLITLVEEAPQRKIEALCKKLLDPATTPNRQRYLLECLKTIGKPEAIKVVKKFIERGLSNNLLSDKLGAQYVLIKGGTFFCSLTKQREEVPDIYMAKYTVTNQHYRRFISYLESKDLEFAAILPVATFEEKLRAAAKEVKKFSEYLQTRTSLSTAFCSDIHSTDEQFNKDDQPVVCVNWFAAQAYCLWLSFLESNGLDSGRYCLPRNIEWEYSAAGKDGREYPWSHEKGIPTSIHANYNYANGNTTPVGNYPHGITPEGLYDMAGNVWEWMKDWVDRKSCFIRGGSWSFGDNDLRCSSFDSIKPESRKPDIGFRVIRKT